MGDSAGGQILSLYADICTNAEYAKEYDFQVPEGLKIKAVALNCGQYNMEDTSDMTRQLMEEYLPGKGTPEELKRISSDLYITDQFPPAYVMTAEGDFLRKQAPYMYGKLKEKNVFCELHEYSSPKEKLMHVFHLNMRSEDAKRCNDDECEFFRKFIGR